MKNIRGYLLIMGGASLWGMSATVAKFLLNREIDTVLIVQCRVTFSAVVLFMILLTLRPGLLKIRPGVWWQFALAGICGVAGANFFYYFAIKETTVATAILIQYTAPLAVMFYAASRGLERVTPVKLTAAVVSLTGCFLALGAWDLSAMRWTPAGLLSAVGAMLAFAFLSLYSKHLLDRYHLWTTTVWSFVFASLFWMIVNPPWVIAEQNISSDVWGSLFLLAMISVLIPHSMFLAGLRLLVPSRAVITSTLEPVVAIVTASIVLGELLEPLQILGAVLVLCAIVLLQVYREQRKTPVTVQADAA